MNEISQDAAGPLAGLGSLLQVGGPVVAILLGMSVVALTVILAKLWQFAWLRLGDQRSLDAALEHWAAGRAGEALEVLSGSRSPAARVVEQAMRGQMDPQMPEALVREEVARVAGDWLESLRGQFRTLEVIGSLAPLLGLLGTVLGMISAFQALEAAGSPVDPVILSGGIWVALSTTAVGLAVAIPVVAVLNALERWLERFRHRMQDAVTRVFTVRSEDARQRPSSAPAPLRPVAGERSGRSGAQDDGSRRVTHGD
ncbi:MAG: MotA/TolQ/ExbB proton channel family protein [Ectothiorhodospira sp.]